MFAKFAQPIAQLFGLTGLSEWLGQDSVARDICMCFIFSALTIWIVARGVNKEIETWSTRLMPMFALLLIALIMYVLTQPGALEGLRIYLLPDFSRVQDPELLLSAMGQAFFSLSLGVGTLLIYGSYLGRVLSENNQHDKLPRLGASLTLLDTSFAFCAGLLIIPAMYRAQLLTSVVAIFPNTIHRMLPG